ncbi:hypothetical protein VYU27_001351 [Nannochloropsis oceanica]
MPSSCKTYLLLLASLSAIVVFASSSPSSATPPVSSSSFAATTYKTTDTSNITPIEDMADKHSSDSGKGTGAAFSAKDLGFKVPGTGSGPTDERIFNQPPRSWPELVGVDAEEAKARINSDMPGLNVIVLPKNAPTTRDFRLDRVRVFIEGDNTVARAPAQG